MKLVQMPFVHYMGFQIACPQTADTGSQVGHRPQDPLIQHEKQQDPDDEKTEKDDGEDCIQRSIGICNVGVGDQ